MLSNFFGLLIASASNKTISVRNWNGDSVRVGVASAAINELKRPPFILSAPTEKRVWSPEEIEEFYKRNPIFK